ncbi:hypothetical protein IAR55_003456 [Kwoniella newhampshirensis]|uniref:Phospholipid binding protein n=1 Tax=Kwoniella newhampshirensis TaxID=1651941 RepID=A0AAW0YMH6_9TREE
MVLVVSAIHTFVAEHGDELEFQAGERIEVIEKDDAFGDGWWRGRNEKGEEGLFPATYISESPPTPHAAPAPLHNDPPSPKARSINGHSETNGNGHIEPNVPTGELNLAPPSIPIPDESPRGTSTSQTQGGILDTAVTTVEAAAASVGNVMSRTIGEVQDAIESITARPDSDDEQELGIGQGARAKLAEQARLANEQREQRSSGGVTGLVYSDESEDEEDEQRKSLQVGKKGISSPALNGFHSISVAADQPILAKAPAPSPGLPTSTSTPPVPSPGHLDTSSGPLEPALQLPSTPPLDKPSNRSSGISGKSPATWNVEDVFNWAQAKGFDEPICEKFKELDIPQFGKRMRIAAAISELRRPSSMISSSSQQFSPSGLPLGSSSMSSRGMSAPPNSTFGQPFQSTTPPLTTPPMSATSDEALSHAAWAHGRKTSGPALGMAAPLMEAINENQAQTPASTTQPSSTAASMPASPVTPSSGVTKRESTGSMGHKRGKPSIENKERLSFFGRTRKPAPASIEQQRASSRLGFPTNNKVHQMQPATPESNKRISGSAVGATGTAAALKQIGKPDYSGYMKKKGERYGTWKQRFFVLKGAHLYYMKSETEDRVKGHIELAGHRVIVDVNTNPGSYGFRLVGNNGEKTHYFSSPEQTKIREWMKALMKATIARDYTVPVTSSCNIPTIPLAEAQALQPRPPSPATRDATQRATRRENPNQLTAHDANVLVSGLSMKAALTLQMSLDTTSGERRRASTQLSVPSPGRPSRDTRRPSSNFSAVASPPKTSPSNSMNAARPSVASIYPTDEGSHHDLVHWVNSLLPPIYPRASSIPQSFVSGEVIFLLVKHLSGIEPSPPVPPTAFAPEANGQPGLEGLFAMMDTLIDAGVDTAGVSINDVRLGDSGGISRLLKSVKGWHEHNSGGGTGLAQ